jgi:UV DNA damage endonuclease
LQFTQLGSPRKEVVTAAVRDLEYHDELLSLLRLPDQQNRDAVMILHMGGVFGDRSATLNRFRENYAKLSDSIKARLVLENDDVAWSVHDLLPICEELNIPSPRVATLPPCPPDTDLMIEAKDKEQAVFELMRTFKLPGFERINDMIPFERDDESRPAPKTPKKKKAGALRRKRALDEDPVDLDDAGAGADDQESVPMAKEVSAQDFAMGGPLNRVYWPPGREEWLKPPKRSLKQGVVNEDDVV